MVISAKERSAKKPAEQGFAEDIPKPIKINGSTHFDFEGKNLTAYGGRCRWRRCWRSSSFSNWSSRPSL